MIFIFYLLCLFALIGTYIEAPSFIDTNFIGIVFLIDIAILIAFTLINIKKFKKNLFRHSIFIILGFVIVHFQYIADYFFNGYVVTPIDIWINKGNVCKGLVISSLGLLAFAGGYQYFLFNSNITKTRLQNHTFKNKRVIKSLTGKYPIVLVILAWAFFLLFIYTADPKYLLGYYGSVDAGEAANRFQLLLGLFTSATVIIVSYNLKDVKNKSFWVHVKSMGWLFNMLVISYVATTLFIGDRGPAITLLLIYFAGYVFRVKDRPKPVLVIVLLLVGTFLMSAVRQYRATDKNLSFVQRLELSFQPDQRQTGYSQTHELAGSVRALHIAINNVPANRDFAYGWFQLRQILIVIPGMSNLLDYINPNYEDKGSTHLITYLDQGRFFTYGEGTTIIADFYIDLGVFGVFLGMFIFGYFIGKFESVAFTTFSTTSVLTYVFVMVFMSKSIYFSRSTALFALQESLWIFAIIYINNKYLRNLGRKMLAKPANE